MGTMPTEALPYYHPLEMQRRAVMEIMSGYPSRVLPIYAHPSIGFQQRPFSGKKAEQGHIEGTHAPSPSWQVFQFRDGPADQTGDMEWRPYGGDVV